MNFVLCTSCNIRTERPEYFFDLFLNITKSDCQAFNKNLEESLQNLFADETLNGDNKYNCGTCNSKQDAIKGMRLVDLPTYVSFYINRFSFDMNTFERIKLKNDFVFPLDVNLQEYLDKESQVKDSHYELFAVMIHRGNAYSGHYHIVIKDILNEVY